MRAVTGLTPGALDDQIGAIVRDAGPVPIGTHDVGRRLGRYRPVFITREKCRECGHVHNCRWKAAYERSYWPADIVRPSLKRLMKRGLVERIQIPRGAGMNPLGQDYWRWIGPSDQD